MKILVVLLLAAISGCGAAPMIKTAASFAVDRYCVLPSPARMVIRSDVAVDLAPNSIEISCAD